MLPKAFEALNEASRLDTLTVGNNRYKPKVYQALQRSRYVNKAAPIYGENAATLRPACSVPDGG